MVVFVSFNILSLVVARAGSKGIKNKNINPIYGTPTYLYTVRYSKELEHKYPLKTVVSTDSREILEYCTMNYIQSIDRDSKLSGDKVRIEDVIYDAIKRIPGDYEYVSLLYSDVPTRYPEEFDKAYEFMKYHKDYDAAISFKKIKKHPEYMAEYNDDIFPKIYTKNYRRQDLKEYMIHDGHTILIRKDYFIKFMESNKDVDYLYEAFGSKIKPIINDKFITSIDNEYDYKFAEMILYDNSRSRH